MDKIIDWPSERVPQGGIFHQRNINYSKETHEMIKSNDEKMMRNFFNSLVASYFHFLLFSCAFLYLFFISSLSFQLNLRPVRSSDLMSEAKLTMLQRKKINCFLRQGSALPQPKIPRRQLPSEEYELRQAQEMMERSRVMRRRSLDTIMKSGAFSAEKLYFSFREGFSSHSHSIHFHFADMCLRLVAEIMTRPNSNFKSECRD